MNDTPVDPSAHLAGRLRYRGVASLGPRDADGQAGRVGRSRPAHVTVRGQLEQPIQNTNAKRRDREIRRQAAQIYRKRALVVRECLADDERTTTALEGKHLDPKPRLHGVRRLYRYDTGHTPARRHAPSAAT